MFTILFFKGPEIRTGELENHAEVELAKNQELILSLVPCVGNAKKIYVDYKNMGKVLKLGDKVLIDDGLIGTTVTDINLDTQEIKVIVENTGMLGEKKVCYNCNANLW